MNDRQKHQKHLPGAHRPKNTLSSNHTPRFTFDIPPSQPKRTSRGFRVPSPTDSEEEELRILELESNSSDHFSRLGDSSPLFSSHASIGTEQKLSQLPTVSDRLFQFVGSSPRTTSSFTFTSSPPSTRTSLDGLVPHWLGPTEGVDAGAAKHNGCRTRASKTPSDTSKTTSASIWKRRAARVWKS